jgi:disulfide oxidoreductase YuzD
MLKLSKKQKFEKYVIIFFCLLIVGNLANWKVLCFGADGHIELESAFHERCDDPKHNTASDLKILSSQTNQEICKHCGTCVDIPISNELVQIYKSAQKSNPKFPVQTAYMFIEPEKLNSYVYNLDSKTVGDTPYFTPLHTVILLI